MSDPRLTEQRICRFPDCARPAVPSDGTGRPPEYCEDPGHNRAAAWRARHRQDQQQAGRVVVDEQRPVDAARQRASEIRGQVAGMVEHLGVQLNALVDELRTVADPDAAEAQIESVTVEAAEQVSAAVARASRAEQAQRRAETEQAEADAAATEASDLAEHLQNTAEELRLQLVASEQAREQATVVLLEVQAAAEAQQLQAQGEVAELREQLTATHARLSATERDRDDAVNRAEAATVARAEAEERARGAVARTDIENARANRAETETLELREQLEQARAEHDEARDALGDLRGHIATVTAERDGARAEIEREQLHADQRVTDLRTSHEQHISQLREELTQLRAELREQRSRADRAETAP